MALSFTIISTLLGAGINAAAFGGLDLVCSEMMVKKNSLGFSMLRNDGEKERERHDLAEEQLQKARDKCNED